MKASKWTTARAKLKRQFTEWNIQSCEICGGTFALSFAHRLKRRFITTDAELLTVVLLCQKHHEQLEFSGHEQMRKSIDAIIQNRSTEPVW